MIALGNIHCYADDSTVHGRYFGHPTAKPADIEEKGQELVAQLDDVVGRIS